MKQSRTGNMQDSTLHGTHISSLKALDLLFHLSQVAIMYSGTLFNFFSSRQVFVSSTLLSLYCFGFKKLISNKIVKKLISNKYCSWNCSNHDMFEKIFNICLAETAGW